jgi:cob(I)alamin adenosyltransferase
MKIYTRTGDDGTTGLYFGGRVPKDNPQIELNGTVDEAQAFLGWSRSLTDPASQVHNLIADLQRDLWILMAEVATSSEQRTKLTPGKDQVTPEMVGKLEGHIDEWSAVVGPITEFIVPGKTTLSASLDVSRTVVRRAERHAFGVLSHETIVPMYLNRLSDLLWILARAVEGKNQKQQAIGD